MSSNDAESRPNGHYSGEHSHTESFHDPEEFKPVTELRLPDLDLPKSELDLTMTFESILSEVKGASGGGEHQETEKVQKRQSNVLKLAEQNEKLKAELRAMTERIEAAERKQRELAERAKNRGAVFTPPSKT
ncbi:hypothetical protein C8Q75DRAFT_28565 [Abortiporus biennis]|nr:hypothetical protein C8Q75DRAFT_28565 [Abortiporus biennis]